MRRGPQLLTYPDSLVVRRILELVRLRMEHSAFEGELEVALKGVSLLRLRWFNGSHIAELMADLATGEIGVVSCFFRAACRRVPNGTSPHSNRRHHVHQQTASL